MVLSLVSACAAQPSISPAPPAAAQENFSNARLGYSWTLPADWESIPPETLWPSIVSDQDVHAARKKGQLRPAVWVHVVDLVQIVPGPPRRDPERLLEGARSNAALLLEPVGGQVVDARRVPMLGHEAIEVNGETIEDTVTIRTVYVGYRKFELRCLGPQSAQDWACIDAFRAFRIGALKSELSVQQVPRVLHLREPKLGLAFNPPDDSWLAYGPRTRAGGVQTVWFWNKDGRQIDVGVMRLSSATTGMDQATFVARLVLTTQRGGAKVTEKASTLSGEPSDYLEITNLDGTTEDLLILVRGRLIYMIRIGQPTRDTALVEAARRGFRLISE